MEPRRGFFEVVRNVDAETSCHGSLVYCYQLWERHMTDIEQHECDVFIGIDVGKGQIMPWPWIAKASVCWTALCQTTSEAESADHRTEGARKDLARRGSASHHRRIACRGGPC